MREWVAAALLLALLLGSLGNIAYLDRLIGNIETELDHAAEAAEAGDFDAALRSCDRALAHWLRADAYTHIFIRHPEIDAIADAFYELRQLLAEENAQAAPSAFQKLRYHLDCIDNMEHIRPGSIL